MDLNWNTSFSMDSSIFEFFVRVWQSSNLLTFKAIYKVGICLVLLQGRDEGIFSNKKRGRALFFGGCLGLFYLCCPFLPRFVLASRSGLISLVSHLLGNQIERFLFHSRSEKRSSIGAYHLLKEPQAGTTSPNDFV